MHVGKKTQKTFNEQRMHGGIGVEHHLSVKQNVKQTLKDAADAY